MTGRTAFAATVAVALTGTLAPLAGAAQVTIVPARSGDEKTLSDAQLEAAASDQEYTAGGARDVRSGISLDRLIEIADVDPVYGYAEVVNPAGQPVRLSEDQVTGADPLPGGSPFVHWDAQGTYFVRPDGEDGSWDRVAGGGGVTIVLRSGRLLDVEIKASDTRVEPGESVTFQADVPSAGAGQRLDYAWTIAGGRSESGVTSFQHRFRKRGNYKVTLGVTAAGDLTGDSDVVRIQVGKPSKKGPDRPGTGTNDDADAPDSGAADGPSGSDGSSGETASASPAQSPTPKADPKPATPKPEPKPEEDRAPLPPIGPAAAVSGKLLANFSPKISSTSPQSRLGEALRRALRSGTATPAKAADELGVPAEAWSLGGTLLLLGLGAGLELRHARQARAGSRSRRPASS